MTLYVRVIHEMKILMYTWSSERSRNIQTVHNKTVLWRFDGIADIAWQAESTNSISGGANFLLKLACNGHFYGFFIPGKTLSSAARAADE